MTRRTRLAWFGLMALGLVWGTPAPAATVRYNLVPASNRVARTRTIKTGTTIKYYVTAEVISDTAEPDNAGLALFNINVETDLTVAQPPAEEFIREIFDAFTLFRSLGESRDDDIVGIGASQSTFTPGSATTGFGQRGAQDLVSGFFQAPSVEGEFTVQIDADESTANVLAADYEENGGAISARTITAGPGFTIITSNTAEEDPGDEFNPFTGMTDTSRFLLAAGSIGIVGLIVFLGFLIGGGWGTAIGLFIGGLLGLISLLFSGTLFGGTT